MLYLSVETTYIIFDNTLLVHRLFQSFTYVRDQLQSLWKPTFVDVLFSDVLTVNSDPLSTKGGYSFENIHWTMIILYRTPS